MDKILYKSKIFKTYDIRGIYPQEIDDNFSNLLSYALCELYNPNRVILGMDSRLSSLSLHNSLISGFYHNRVLADSLGLCGTEEIYYQVGSSDYDLGIMITGSHNPKKENGFKIIKRGAIPFSNNDILNLRNVISSKIPKHYENIKNINTKNRDNYISYILKPANLQRKTINKLRVLIDAGNGCAGLVMEELAHLLPFEIIPLNWEPDGNFPNGVPNPLLPEKRAQTSNAVIASGADIGVAFDGDFDRCFFYDHEGNFIDGYYIVGLLAAAILKNHPGEKIIHDPRLYWNTQEIVCKHKGIPIMSKTGHAFIKEKMRAENAIYGGEMSSHHYYRDFFYCDSGMLTMLYVLSLLGNSPIPLSEMIAQSKTAYPISGEINYKTDKKDELIDIVWNKYHGQALYSDHLDGINLEFKEWRFNIRKSNTESLLRLNIESRGNKNLVEDKVHEIQKIINSNSQ